MITLTLLHPIQSTPVQSWVFEREPVIRIGRSTDNHVILYSAVVSRHHVELRQTNDRWEIVNLGANGTYLDGKQITQASVVDGVVIRLARSGPNIQIHFGAAPALAGEKTLAQRSKHRGEEIPTGSQDAKGNGTMVESSGALPLTRQPNTRQPSTEIDQKLSSQVSGLRSGLSPTLPEVRSAIASSAAEAGSGSDCLHDRAQPDMLFCPDCGQPLQRLQMVGDYQVVKTLWEDRFGMTQRVWRDGQNLLLKTLNSQGMAQPDAVELFEQQAAALLQFNHPGLPRFVDFFVINGQPYLVQEQVFGQSLHQWVTTHGALTEAQAIDQICQVCSVLDYLHQQTPPFLHQNLKPETLIQRLPVSPNSLTVSGFLPLSNLRMDTQPTLIGGYNAPEQQQGYTTFASDLYSLGPILVYLLTGKEPNAFYAQREQGFRFYPEYVPGLTTEMAAVIRRLTNPKPEERYANAIEVAEALSQLAAPMAEKL